MFGMLERVVAGLRSASFRAFVLGGAACLVVSKAAAASESEAAASDLDDGTGLGVRAMAGVGVGAGVALGLGLQLEYWLWPRLAVGVGAGYGASGGLYSGGDAAYVAGAISVRSQGVGNYWLLGIDSGFAGGHSRYEDPECPTFSFYEDCSQISEGRKSIYFGATAGWLAHWENFEVGPMLRAQAGAGYGGVLLSLALGWQ